MFSLAGGLVYDHAQCHDGRYSQLPEAQRKRMSVCAGIGRATVISLRRNPIIGCDTCFRRTECELDTLGRGATRAFEGVHDGTERCAPPHCIWRFDRGHRDTRVDDTDNKTGFGIYGGEATGSDRHGADHRCQMWHFASLLSASTLHTTEATSLQSKCPAAA